MERTLPSPIGQRLPRIDGRDKVTGAARFSNDVILPFMLTGKILRSPHPHARILNIDASRALRLPGVKAVVTGRDTAGVKYGIFPNTRDQLILPPDKVRYIGEEVAAVAAVDEDTAIEALSLIDVEYEVLPAVFDPEESLREGAPQLHDDRPGNVSSQYREVRGDPDRAFAESYLVREDRFVTEALAHAMMEPYVAVANFLPSGKLEVWAPNQGPFTKRRALSNLLRMPMDDIRLYDIFIGGAFGGLSEVAPAEFCAALLSRRCGRPVKITYTREETFAVTRQKHPFIMTFRTGVRKDGTFLVQDVKLVTDGGAYTSTGPMPLNSFVGRIVGTFRIPNVRLHGVRAYTNKGVRGAMKGHGMQQARFAIEQQLDMIADELGIDPVEIRLRNALEPDELLANNYRLTSCGMRETIERTAAVARWTEKYRNLPPGRGIGVGCSNFQSGVDLGFRSSSGAFVKFNEDAGVTVITGLMDNGQGNMTLVAQVTAAELGVRIEDVHVVGGDTEVAPSDPGTYTMSATSVSANAVRLAAEDARHQVCEIAAEQMECNPADLELAENRVFVRGTPEKSLQLRQVILAGLNTGRVVLGRGHFMHGRQPDGQMIIPRTFGTAVAEVEVDRETGQVRVLEMTSAHDCGLAINPLRVEEQLEGCVAFGVGNVLTEALRYEGGSLLNANFMEYALSTVLETPRVNPIIVEAPESTGPYGAKEATEAAGCAMVPAIVNAIRNACGMTFDRLPITQEMVLEALSKRPKVEE